MNCGLDSDLQPLSLVFPSRRIVRPTSAVDMVALTVSIECPKSETTPDFNWVVWITVGAAQDERLTQ